MDSSPEPDPWVDEDPWLDDDDVADVEIAETAVAEVSDEPEDALPRTERPWNIRMLIRGLQLVGLIVLALMGSALAAYISTRGGGEVAVSNDGVPTDTSDLLRVGPAVGDQIATYSQRRQSALEGAEGLQRAVVSFGSYLGVSAANDLIDDLEVESFLVAAPGFAPELATDVPTWSAAVLGRADSERLSFEELIPTTDQEDFRADYEAQARRLGTLVEALRKAEDDGVDPAVVFGAVISGGSAEMQQLATLPGVRLVDARSVFRLASNAVFRGLLPEETIQVGTPPVRETPLR